MLLLLYQKQRYHQEQAKLKKKIMNYFAWLPMKITQSSINTYKQTGLKRCLERNCLKTFAILEIDSKVASGFFFRHIKPTEYVTCKKWRKIRSRFLRFRHRSHNNNVHQTFNC